MFAVYDHLGQSAAAGHDVRIRPWQRALQQLKDPLLTRSGVCEEVYNYEGNASDDSFTPIDDVQGAFSCGDGSISITVPKIAILLDIPTFLFIWGITFFVVYTRKGDRIKVYGRLPTLPRMLES